MRTGLQVDPQAPELLLSPHWDDAVLDCWGVLSGERHVHVVNLFAGVPAPGQLAPWDAITGATDSAERARERIAEDARALARAGRTPASLPFLDAQYRRPRSAPDLGELDRSLTAVVGAASRVHAPAGLGGHPDHLLARRYARTLLRAGIPVTLYAELPYCVLHGWPSWVNGSEPDPHRDVNAFWLQFLGDVPELPAALRPHRAPRRRCRRREARGDALLRDAAPRHRLRRGKAALRPRDPPLRGGLGADTPTGRPPQMTRTSAARCKRIAPFGAYSAHHLVL